MKILEIDDEYLRLAKHLVDYAKKDPEKYIAAMQYSPATFLQRLNGLSAAVDKAKHVKSEPAATSAIDKMSVELDGLTLKIQLTGDVLKLIEDAHAKYMEVADEIGLGTGGGIGTTVSHILFYGGLAYDSPSFRAWLKERVQQFIDHEDFILEQHQEERGKYCDECDELLEDCRCYEDEDNG